MNDVYYNIKSVSASALLTVMSFLNPIHMDILVICIMIVGNFFFGWWESVKVKEERFKIDKFTKAMSEGLVYVILVIGVYIVLKMKGIEDKAIYCTSVISYAVIYFLGLNILRNLKSLYPDSRVLAFLYFCGSLEFTKTLPLLKKFLSYESEQQTKK